MSKEQEILAELERLANEKDLNIINARERGSRMLGASHARSDWDVLFLFAQEAHNYATIHGHIDSIHEPHLGDNDEIDLHGWNVDKFGELIRDSNPNAIEYCRPDATEYTTASDEATTAFDTLASNAREHFNHMSLYHHYISMGKRNWKKYVDSGNDLSKGRQFYVARAIAAAKYIRLAGELPPMDAKELADEMHEYDDNLAATLGSLTLAKINGHKDEIEDDIVGRFYKQESEATMEPTDERIHSPDDELIDDFIRASLR